MLNFHTGVVVVVVYIQAILKSHYCESVPSSESKSKTSYSTTEEATNFSETHAATADVNRTELSSPSTTKYASVRTTAYEPLRLTDPPKTTTDPSRRWTGTSYEPLRLTDPPTPKRLTDAFSTTEFKSTTYRLSVDPVTIEPEKRKTLEEIHKDCLTFEIIPDLFADTETPPNSLEVRYLFELLPEFGNALDPKDLIYRPYYLKWPYNSSLYYTLLMLDIDNPCRSHPYMRSWKHWMVVNIKGDKWIDADEWAEYVGPNPHFGSGFHRYVFLMFQQPGHIYFDELIYPKMRLDEHRANFSVSELKNKYKLIPWAINFFQAQWMSDFVYP